MHDKDVGRGLVDNIATAKAHHMRGTQSLAATTGLAGSTASPHEAVGRHTGREDNTGAQRPRLPHVLHMHGRPAPVIPASSG
jgi:hypothetical protein